MKVESWNMSFLSDEIGAKILIFYVLSPSIVNTQSHYGF